MAVSSLDIADARGIDSSDPLQAGRSAGHRTQLGRVLVERVLSTLESIEVTAVRPPDVAVPRDERAIDAGRRQSSSGERSDHPKAEIRVLAEPQALIESSGLFQ